MVVLDITDLPDAEAWRRCAPSGQQQGDPGTDPGHSHGQDPGLGLHGLDEGGAGGVPR